MTQCDHLPDPSAPPGAECALCKRERVRAQANGGGNPTELRAGPSIAPRATLKEWLKSPGDAVAVDEPVAILLDSAARQVIVSARIKGTLVMHRVKTGATVKPETALAKLAPARGTVPIVGEDRPAAAPVIAPVEVIAPAQDVAEPEPAIVPPPQQGAAAPEPTSSPEAVTVPEPVPAAAAPIGAAPSPEPVQAAAPAQSERIDMIPQGGSNGREPPPPPPDDVVDPDRDGPDDASEVETVVNRLSELGKDGIFVVSLIGFPEAGKTWFLNRLKYEYSKGHVLSIPFARNRSSVTRSNSVTFHEIISAGRKALAIVDPPGEMLSQLTEEPKGVSRALVAGTTLLSMIYASDALIVASPADEVLASHYAVELSYSLERIRAKGDDIGAEDKALLDRWTSAPFAERLKKLTEADGLLTNFTNNIGFLVGLVSLLKSRGVKLDDLIAHLDIDPTEVHRHIGSLEFERYAPPTYIALTKADRIVSPDECVKELLEMGSTAMALHDPREIVRDYRDELIVSLDEWFIQYKFDFVSAFEGHDNDSQIDYDKPTRGMLAVIDWLAWSRRLKKLSVGERRAMEHARRIRQRRDGPLLAIRVDALGDRVERG